MESMISNVFINNDNDKIEELMVMIKLLSLSVPHNDSDGDGNEASIRVLLCVLSSCKGKSISSPYTILEAVTSIVTSSSSSSSTLHDLPSNEAESLRNLIVQCLHGGAPEKIRDGTLSCIQDLMTSSSSCISLSWTIEDSRGGANMGQFAIMLCSIVRGEFHLLLQELITLYDTNSDSSSNSDNYIKESISVERKERILSIVFVCCSLMESFLCLLVGTSDDNDDVVVDSDDEVDVLREDIPIWSSLPYTCLLHMRESFHSVCQDVFDFILIISKRSINNDISKIVHRLIEMINIWIVEDESMINTCLKYIPNMLMCSVIASSLSSRNGDDDDDDIAKGIKIWSNTNDIIIPFANILKTICITIDDDNDDNDAIKQQLLTTPNLTNTLVLVTTSICSSILISGYEEFQGKPDVVDLIFVLGYTIMDTLVRLLKWRSTELHDDNNTRSISIMIKKIQKLSKMMDMPSYESIIPFQARKNLRVLKETMKCFI